MNPTITEETGEVTRTSASPVGSATTPGRLLSIEVRDELLAIVREPTALFFSIAMPVGFFAMLATLWGGETSGSTVAGTSMLATFGTFGVLGVTLFIPGTGIADDRERGWLRAKRVSATPLPVTLAAKCVATIPYAVGVLTAMTAVAALTGTLQIDGGSWLRLIAVLVLGGLPFGLFGLAVGLSSSPNATVAILQAVLLPSVIASGLMFPLEMLPEVVQRIAPMLPPYHLAQLGMAQIEGGAAGTHVVVLVSSTVVAAALAAAAYRRARP